MTDHDNKLDDAGFLNRWSQRKNQLEQETKKEQDIVVESERKTIAEEELKTDADMPPLESLSEDSDYSGFLSPKVSEVLRKQALRKLFHLPSLNVVDGLDDYAEDFTHFEPLGDLVTEEMKRVFAREKKKEEEKAEAEANENATAEQVEEECDESMDDADVETEADTQNTEMSDAELATAPAITHEVEDQSRLQSEELLNNKDNVKHE